MTDEQGLALARLMRDRPDARVEINRQPFELPEGYVFVMFTTDGRDSSTRGFTTSTFACGIAPDGGVSS